MYYIKYLEMFRAILCLSSGRQNCIFTASGIVTVCERPYSAPVESGIQLKPPGTLWATPGLFYLIYIYTEVVNISKHFCFTLYFNDEIFLLNNSCPVTGVRSSAACRPSLSSRFILLAVRLIQFRLYDLIFFTHHSAHGVSGTVLGYVTELFSFSTL
jgi:hypothetical protein